MSAIGLALGVPPEPTEEPQLCGWCALLPMSRGPRGPGQRSQAPWARAHRRPPHLRHPVHPKCPGHPSSRKPSHPALGTLPILYPHWPEKLPGPSLPMPSCRPLSNVGTGTASEASGTRASSWPPGLWWGLSAWLSCSLPGPALPGAASSRVPLSSPKGPAGASLLTGPARRHLGKHLAEGLGARLRVPCCVGAILGPSFPICELGITVGPLGGCEVQ